MLPSTPLNVTDVSDYREELVLILFNARNIAMKTNLESQRRYKEQYDKTAVTPTVSSGLEIGYLYTLPKKRLGRCKSSHSHGMVLTELCQGMILMSL